MSRDEEHVGQVPHGTGGVRVRFVRRLQGLCRVLGFRAERADSQQGRLSRREARFRRPFDDGSEGAGDPRRHVRLFGERKGLQGAGSARPRHLGRRHRLFYFNRNPQHSQNRRLVRRQHRLRLGRRSLAKIEPRHAEVRLQMFLRSSRWHRPRRLQRSRHRQGQSLQKRQARPRSVISRNFHDCAGASRRRRIGRRLPRRRSPPRTLLRRRPRPRRPPRPRQPAPSLFFFLAFFLSLLLLVLLLCVAPCFLSRGPLCFFFGRRRRRARPLLVRLRSEPPLASVLL
mmetsp:Transcript_17536/g.53476  ORF Transcript_17536/g.53476 Transcript_17536/m.53476 type:complete len:285 (+) Transcript_17536:801-1655(+)